LVFERFRRRRARLRGALAEERSAADGAVEA
jgi:hypothetical protein